MESENDDSKNDNGIVEIFNERDWIAIAGVMLIELPANIGLGNRDFDLLNEWSAAYYNYPDIKNNSSFIEINRERKGDQCAHVLGLNITFNKQHKKILNFSDWQISTFNDCYGKLAIIQRKV